MHWSFTMFLFIYWDSSLTTTLNKLLIYLINRYRCLSKHEYPPLFLVLILPWEGDTLFLQQLVIYPALQPEHIKMVFTYTNILVGACYSVHICLFKIYILSNQYFWITKAKPKNTYGDSELYLAECPHCITTVFGMQLLNNKNLYCH